MLNRQPIQRPALEFKFERKTHPKECPILKTDLNSALFIYRRAANMIEHAINGDCNEILKLREFNNSIQAEDKKTNLSPVQLASLIQMIREVKLVGADRASARKDAFNYLKNKFHDWDNLIIAIDLLKKWGLDTSENIYSMSANAKEIKNISTILEAIPLVNQDHLDKLFHLCESHGLTACTTKTFTNGITELINAHLATKEHIDILFKFPFLPWISATIITRLHQNHLEKYSESIFNVPHYREIAFILHRLPIEILNEDHIKMILQLGEAEAKLVTFATGAWPFAFKLCKEDMATFFEVPLQAYNYAQVIKKLNAAKLDTAENIRLARLYVANAERLNELLTAEKVLTQMFFDDCVVNLRRELKLTFLMGLHPKETKRDDLNPSHVWKFFGARNSVPNQADGDLNPLRIVFAYL